MNDYISLVLSLNMVKFPGDHFDRSEVKIESVVAELVDNSASKGMAKNISVFIMEDVEDAEFCKELDTETIADVKKSFSISVVDDGNGFASEEQLHNDFKITKLPEEKEDRSEGEQGLFFVGMKEASLNKFHHFTMFANIDDVICSRSIRFPANESEFLYEWMPYPNEGNNPSSELPTHLLDHDWIQSMIKEGDWSTLAHASVARETLVEHDLETDIEGGLEKFQESLSIFLGIVYRKSLINKDFNLTIFRINGEDDGNPIKVEPVDLFLENWTPEKILEHVAQDDDLSEDKKYIATNIAGFGTVKGNTSNIEFNFKGGLVNARFTPYILPRTNIQKKLRETLGDKVNGEVMFLEGSEGHSKYSKIWKSENVQGFTFTRSDRTIVIGNHDKAEQYGFYLMENLGFKMNITKTRVRFHVEYDITPHNDAAFKLFMNKNGYKKVDDQFFNVVMDILQGSYIDGAAKQLSKPHDINAPFFRTGPNSRHFHTAYSAAISKPFSSDRLADCVVPGCNSIHYGETEKIRTKSCPKRPCKVCGTSLYNSRCTANVCNYRCTNEGCENPVGHTETNCPTIICSSCGFNKLDCKCCGTCNTPILGDYCTVCPCSECGEGFDEDGGCGCAPPEPEDPVIVAVDEDEFGILHTADFYPGNKNNSLKLIKDILSETGITIQELISFLEE